MNAKQNAPRLFLDADLAKDKGVILDRDQSHYLVNVMRKREGEELVLFNGRDGEWRGEIQQAKKNQCLVHVLDHLRPQTASPDIQLAFAPVKKIQNGFIVQKATELGVSAFRPVHTERTNSDRLRDDKVRLQAIEAAEQSERLDIPEVYPLTKLEKLLEDVAGEGRHLIYCAERSELQNPVDVLRNIPKDEKVLVLIGPEGGFSDAELEILAGASKATCLKLGPRILRAETAVVSALTLVQSVWGDW